MKNLIATATLLFLSPACATSGPAPLGSILRVGNLDQEYFSVLVTTSGLDDADGIEQVVASVENVGGPRYEDRILVGLHAALFNDLDENGQLDDSDVLLGEEYV
jgi:hypothetical protein